ncbi:hypothetical protein [Burkholderia sp. JKS000303]|uniref:hypothetical protein n=1 Tax=Burkholderia sp. JKS000303 TaxID=1938747 RepID=UPI000BF75605|nr:hypothetical protein [Burkholderia sp. JKS000303]PFH12740.1 hypothetical protein BX604_7551 [Burkholderia sp. JKS000303]
MAIRQNAGASKSMYLEYSSTPGVLLISNEATRAIVTKARELVGEEAWKRGFDGFAGKTVARQVRKFFEENGIPSSTTLDGEITSAYYSEREHDNGLYQDIRVKFVDPDTKEGYLVTLPLYSGAAQMLIRKLANDTVTRGTYVKAFSVFPGQGREDQATNRTYYDSTVQLKGEDGEIKQAGGIFEDAVDAVNSKIEAAKAAGLKDRQVLRTVRSNAVIEFYKEILQNQIEPKFKLEDEEKADDEQVGRRVEQPRAPAGGFDEMDDDIPF